MARIQAAVLFDGVRGPRALFSGLGDFRWLGIGVFDFLLIIVSKLREFERIQ
jgi:hypothetical protein